MMARPGLYLRFLLPVLCGVAMAQEVVPGQPASKAIQLDVVVAPKSGTPVPGLQERDFVVLDNKVPQTVTSFRGYEGKPEPVEVILLIDSVNTTFSNIAYERGEIDKFLNANGGELSQPTTLAILTDEGVKKETGFTKDGRGLAASLDKQTIGLRQLTRSTGFYGAGERSDISLNALRQLLGYEATRPGRKVILWVSPGWPLLPGTQGYLTSGQAKNIYRQIVLISSLLRQSQTTIYNINPLGASEGLAYTFEYENFLKGVKKPNDSNLGNLALQVLATQSGGLVLTGNSDISGMLARCMAEAGEYYRLSYEPPTAGGKDEFHSVEVQVAEPGLKARTLDTYYTGP
jgi:VWFA-related protein